MIERLARIASHLHRFRRLLWLFAVAALAVFGTRLVGAQALEGDASAMASLLAFLWALLFLSVGGLFHAVPASAPDAAWTIRVSIWLRRLGYRLLGVCVIGLAVCVVVLSYQLLRVLWG
jgi:hypothetical protein